MTKVKVTITLEKEAILENKTLDQLLAEIDENPYDWLTSGEVYRDVVGEIVV